MIYALTVDQVDGLPECFRLTRKDGKSYTVRGLEALGKRIKKEAAKATESPFIIRDQNGRAMFWKPAQSVFVYT